MAYQSINPYTGKRLATLPYQSLEEANNALELASLANRNWRAIGFTGRAIVVHRLAELLRKRIGLVANTITAEMGKITREADGEIHKSADSCDYFALKAASLLADEPLYYPDGTALLRHEPLGTILGIMPWNFPLWQVIRFTIPTLMAGNVVIIKHAENVPQSALLIAQLFADAGFPEGVYQNLLIDNDTTAQVIAHPLCAGVSLTGSHAAGCAVAATAGKNLKKSVMELGGSDPFIVLADADIPSATEAAAKSRYMNAGQVCISAKRFIVDNRIAGAFVTELQKQAEKLRVGDPLDTNTTLATMARADLRDKLQRQVDESIAAGARVVTGCQPLPDYAGYPASILDHVTPDMPAFDEEIFGPVASIIRVDSIEEAITAANRSRYGLAASVWTRDIARAQEIAEQLDVGSAFINMLPKTDVHLPIGGTKQSGYGKELGTQGIREFVNSKVIVAPDNSRNR